jgi:hypothetical protein
VVITPQMLRHAVTHRKNCTCYKSDERDPNCTKDWPDICPWWAYQLHRHITGDMASPEWWAYQCGFRDDYSDEPPDPRQFEDGALGTLHLGRDRNH